MKPQQESIKKISFITLDLETTGSHEKRDEIIEIGMVKIKNLKIVDELHFLIKPTVKIPIFVQRLTSITPKDIVDAPFIEDVIEKILAFIGDSVIVAHNISFDLPFFNSVLRRMKRPALTNPSLCTLTISQHLIPNILSSNLKYMNSLFQLPCFRAHRALDDAKACALLFLHFLDLFQKKGLHRSSWLFNLPQSFNLTERHFTEQEKGELLAIVKKTNMSLFVEFRNEKNRLLACLPLKKPSQEGAILADLIKIVPYRTCSIRLLGSFFEGCLEYGSHEKKIKKPVNEIIFTHLLQHLKKYKKPPNLNSPLSTNFNSQNFLITHHLIPHQLCLYPLLDLKKNHKLTFRFPENKKKFFQYIKRLSDNSQFSQKKKRPKTISPQLFSFLQNYLANAQKKKPSRYLFIKRDLLEKEPEKAGKLLLKFTKKPKGVQHLFPQEHL